MKNRIGWEIRQQKDTLNLEREKNIAVYNAKKGTGTINKNITCFKRQSQEELNWALCEIVIYGVCGT